MSTIKQILDRVDSQRPNDFEPHTKVRWISELEGRLALNLYDLAKCELEKYQYQCPQDLSKELLVDFPYDEIYYYWLCARIDAEHGEVNKYRNTVELYNSCYSELLRHMAARYGLGDGCNCSNTEGFYLTAYALAVKHGYSGNETEWLSSLVGPPGPQGAPGAKIRIGNVFTLPVGEAARAQIGGTSDDPVLNLWIPAGTSDVVKRSGDVMDGPLDMGGSYISGLPDNIEGYGGPLSEDMAVSYGILKNLLLENGVDIASDSLKNLPSSYETLSLDLLEAGTYMIQGQTIHGVSEGLLILKKLTKMEDAQNDIALEYLISSDGEQIWMRIRWYGEKRSWKQLSFGYGNEVPENGVEGQLYFVEG